MDLAEEPSLSEPSEAEHTSAASMPKHNKGGRPKGSRNKVSLEARAVLEGYGPQVFERLCRIALGLPVLNRPEGKGPPVKRIFSDDIQMKAAQMVAERLVPQLKAVEKTLDATVNGGTTYIGMPGDLDICAPGESRLQAKAFLAVLQRGAEPDATPLEADNAGRLASILSQSPAWADMLANAGGPEQAAQATPDAIPEYVQGSDIRKPATLPSPSKPAVPMPGDQHKIEHDGRIAIIRFDDTLPDRRQRWGIYRCDDGMRMEYAMSREAAESRAKKLLAERKL